MAKRKTNSYWLSLIALLLVASMVLSVGDTQARYVNTTVWNTVVYPTSDQIVSDCLRPEGQTILLGEMELDALEITFTLESTRAISGKLSAVVDLDELLKVELSQEKVEMEAYETVEITMTLIPTDMAIDTPRPELDVNILVALDGMLSGTFRVTLPELTEEDLGIIPTEPEETEPEETEPDPTDPEETEPEATDPEATEPEATEPQVTEPEAAEPEQTQPETEEPSQSQPTESTEPTENTQEPTESAPSDQTGEDSVTPNTSEASVPEGEAAQQETEVLFVAVPRYLSGAIIGSVSTGSRSGSFSSASNTENGDAPIAEVPASPETSEPSEEPSESTEESSEATEESSEASEDTTAASESETTEPADEDQEPAPDAIGVRLSTLEAFDPDADLPVLVLPEEDTTRVVLGFGMEEDGVITLTEFPRYTRYSLDGENYFMFYFGGLIELDTTAVAEKAMLLDLGDIGLSRNQAVALAARAYDVNKLLGSTSTHSVAGADIDYALNTKVITDYNPTLIITLPDEWKGCRLDYEVSLLVANQETGVMRYQSVKLGDSLKANHSYGASSPHWLTFELGEEKPQPGTYRLSMSWTFEGICFAKTQTTFFINYSGSR